MALYLLLPIVVRASPLTYCLEAEERVDSLKSPATTNGAFAVGHQHIASWKTTAHSNFLQAANGCSKVCCVPASNLLLELHLVAQLMNLLFHVLVRDLKRFDNERLVHLYVGGVLGMR